MGTLAVVELASRSGQPRDKVVNTYAIAESALVRGTGDQDDNYVTALTTLYTAASPIGGLKLGELLGLSLSRAADACSIKLYDITDHLDGSPHGSPRLVAPLTLPTVHATGEGQPEEVALCVTFEAKNRSEQRVEIADGIDADAKPDRPRQRYTGRVYLGPFVHNNQAVTVDANGFARPATNLKNCIIGLFTDFFNDVDTLTGDEASIGVWSRKDEAIRGCDNFRFDDAWDTQRRRGSSPTTIVRTAAGGLVPELELGA